MIAISPIYKRWDANFKNELNSIRRGFRFKSLFLFCVSTDGKIIERVYEIPEEEVEKRRHISIYKNPMNTRGTRLITPWYEKYKVKYLEELKKVNKTWDEILREELSDKKNIKKVVKLMSGNGIVDESLREELGFTTERGNELLRITQSIMDQCVDYQRRGRTSHVLLHIAGRKDLNDVEKVACTFLFALKVSKNDHKMPGIPKITNIGLDPNIGIDCMVVSPEGVEMPEMMAVLMATLMSMLRQIPNDDARNFCRNASISFARMAMTGDIHL